MPPIRFLHAAGLNPDAVLPEAPASLGDLIEAAPLAAVERLVTEAIEREVDFLLVTPAPPADGLPDGPSLRAEDVLREQFERLAELGIPVYLAVGSRPSGWERIAEGDSEVIFLAPGGFAPIADRDGRPVAVLRCVDRPTAADRSSPPRPDDALELAVAPLLAAGQLAGVTAIRHDHLALGIGPRQTVTFAAGSAHAPGAMQGVESSECGPRGATLVTIDEAGKATTEFVPTAAVRFEAITIEAEPDEPPDDLALRMSEILAQRSPEPGERAWLVRWTIEAAGALLETLNHPARRAELLGLLPEAVGGVPAAHEAVVVPHPLRPALDDPFAAEFAAALAEQEGALSDPSKRLALLGLEADTPHRRRLARFVAEVDPAAVLGGARRFGGRVVAAANEEQNHGTTRAGT